MDLIRDTESIEDISLDLTDNFTHLHVHTIYSLLDGYNFPKTLAKRAKELGMTSLAITDHNHLGGVIEFQAACKAEGINPILGLEAYWTHDMNTLALPKEDRDKIAMDKAAADGVMFPKKAKKADIKEILAPYEYDTRQYHIILLAINQTGWRNIVKLQSEAAERCTFNGRYCCDDSLLEKYSEGVIMTTACVGNIIPHLIEQGKWNEANAQIDRWHQIFGDRLFLEIQPLQFDLQYLTNYTYYNWAKAKGINLIATTDTHYTMEADWDEHDTLLCVGMGKKKTDTDRMSYDNEFWLKSYEEMVRGFGTQARAIRTYMDDPEFIFDEYMDAVTEALNNTNLIADMIEDIRLGSDVNLFPRINVPNGFTAETYLIHKCFRGLYQYYRKKPTIDIHAYEARLNEELRIINKKGFAPYMLIVDEYVQWANDHDCPTGPGRGSAAGALSLFTLNITKIIDPMEYNLLFFRFLTEDRTSPPDIDTDFEYYGRANVIQHLKDEYGVRNVAQIGTYTVMGVKSGLKDVGRVLDIDFGVMNALSKKIDDWSDNPSLKFKHLDALKDSDKPNDKIAWDEFHVYEVQYPELFRLARRFEGVVRNMGVHPSGVLVTPMEIDDIFPTRTDDNGTIITLYTGVQLDESKAIKFDILGLKTLTVIKKTLAAINEELTFEDLYDAVDVNDPEMFEMICEKETEGLFQIESNLFKGMIEDIQPNSLNDIIVINALGRPGPLKAGMPQAYAKRKRGEEEAREPLMNTWDLVEDTLGTIVYQEQLMLIAKRVALYNDNQADTYLRKAVAKKKKDKMELCKQWFIYGKLNEEAPENHNPDKKDQPYYDPKGKCGPAILGGTNNGYDIDDLERFWDDMEGYAEYLFNKSHSSTYGYVCILTAHLKKYYTAKFFAALLSMQDTADKVDNYIKTARRLDINVVAPDINLSNEDFSEVDGDIFFGLRSIKGVGATSIPSILEFRPYESLEDTMVKMGKAFNKRVGSALIKAGGFDCFNDNRYEMFNDFLDLRRAAKCKDDDAQFAPEEYDDQACIAFEKEVLGTPITCIPWWDSVMPGDNVSSNMELMLVTEKRDKNGNMMGFITGKINGCEIKCIAFSRVYCNNNDKFDLTRNDRILVEGNKDDKGTLIIKKVFEAKAEKKKERPNRMFEDLDARLEGIL